MKHTTFHRVITLPNPSLNIILSSCYEEPIYKACYADEPRDGAMKGTHILTASTDKSKNSLTVFRKMAVTPKFGVPPCPRSLACSASEAVPWELQSKPCASSWSHWASDPGKSHRAVRGVGSQVLLPHVRSQASAGFGTPLPCQRQPQRWSRCPSGPFCPGLVEAGSRFLPPLVGFPSPVHETPRPQ